MLFRASAVSFLSFLLCHFCGAQIKFPGAAGGGGSRPQPGRKPPTPGQRTGFQAVCAAGTLSFGGSCHPEFTQGPPCPAGQWLVKAPVPDPTGNTGLCQAKPCAENQSLWTIPGGAQSPTPTKACGDMNFGIKACQQVKPNMNGFVDKQKGTGLCDCKLGFLYWPDDDRCYAPFLRGPCPEGEVMFYDKDEKFLACQVNPCDEESFAPWTDEQCYQIGTVGPCVDGGLFQVDPATYTLVCENPLEKQIIKPSACPSGTKRDFNGNCQNPTTFGGSGGSGGGSTCQKGFIRKPDGSCVKWFR